MNQTKLIAALKELYLTLYLPKIIKEIRDVISEPAIWQDMPRKSKGKRIKENIVWYLVNKEACIYYNSYGFDIEGFREKKDYLSYRKFRIERFKEDFPSSIYDSKLCILRDKVLFASYMGNVLGDQYIVKTRGVLYADGRLYDFYKHTFVNPVGFFEHSREELFVKKLKGECGDGCYLVSEKMDIEGFLSSVKG